MSFYQLSKDIAGFFGFWVEYTASKIERLFVGREEDYTDY